MIVKNEEANLERCLRSVHGLVSETNIVDTGSEDNTVEIAERMGARVRPEQWTNDFSHARNISLKMARADWILILDADEVFSPDAIPKIKAAIRNPHTSAYMLPTRNYTNNPKVGGFIPNDGTFEPARHCTGWVESKKIRLFRKRSDIRFEGEIHEVVGPSVMRSGGRVESLDAVVHHFGHLASEDSLRRKFEGMVPIAEAKCKSQKDDYKAHYELGVILAQLGEFDRAERSLRESIALHGDFALAHYDLGVLLSRTGREEEALAHFRAASDIDPNNLDATNNVADSLQRLRRDEEAERIYRTLLDKHPHYKRSWSNLGTLMAKSGRLNEAEQAFKKALAIDPNFRDAQSNLQKLQGLKPAGTQEVPPSHEVSYRPGTISLCMIVRNEEDNLPALLEQVQSSMDEIIIVDTGSTDNTVEIARHCGAEVYEFQWIDDFAAARNFSISKATSEWILILDPDEMLRPDHFAALRNMINGASATGFSFETRNYSGDSALQGWRPVQDKDEMARSFSGWFPSEKVRLFKNSPVISFEGSIHELVEPSILKAHGIIERTEIPIHHYGCVGKTAKAEAYLKPAQAKVEANPRNAQAHFELGAVLHRNGQFEEARASFEKAISLAPENAEYHIAQGDSLRAMQALADAETSYKRALEIRPDSYSAHCGLGITLFHQGDIATAQEEFARALELNPHDSRSLTNLGVICAQEGDTDYAISYFRRALDVNPDNATAQSNLQALLSSSPDALKLGLIMIVRNEESNLVEMLSELASCFDEIVIVDTGSEDETVAIAKRYTDKVFTFPWIDDFSAARNFALAKAEADWILWLDADDRMQSEEVASLRKYISRKEKAYLLTVLSGAGGSDADKFLQIRLFPNIEGVRWEGRVHEQLLPSLKSKNVPLEAIPEVLVTHTGYHDPVVLEKKTQRNVVLLEEELKTRPDDRTVLHHLGQAYAILGEIPKAIQASEALVRVHGSCPPDEILTNAMNRLVQYHLMQDDTETAEEWADRLLTIEPQNRLVRYFLGETFHRKGLFHEAIGWFEQFRDTEDVIGFVPIPWTTLRGNASNFLGICYDKTGNREKARGEFRRAITQGNRIEPYKNLAHLCLQDGHLQEAESVLRDALKMEPSDGDIWTNLGVALARSGSYEEAEEVFRTALEINPAHELARSNLEQVRKKTSIQISEGCDLSLNMIVRNEECNLRECLAPIAELFDEVVVVDTGSTDGTVRAAQRLGARVIRFPWNDNFSDARNAALKNSKGKWVFWLDADDRIDAQAVRTLRKLIAGNTPCGVYVTVESPIGGNGGAIQNYTLRLFPNTPDIQWTGAVHEQIAESLRSAHMRLVKCEDFVVKHVGYENSDESLKKSLRNLKLLSRELAAKPRDPYILLALGQEFLSCGQPQHAVKWLRLLWESRGNANGDENRHIFWTAAILLFDCAVRCDCEAEAVAWLERAIELAPNNWLGYFLLGERRLQEHDVEHAARLLATAAELGISPTLLPLDIDTIKKKLERYLSDFKHKPEYVSVDNQ